MQSLGLVWSNFDPLNADLMETQKAIAEPTQYGARLLWEQWKQKQDEGGFVVGRDVPSRRLACVLRNLAVFETTGGDFRVRLAGTAFTRRFGRDITGLRLSELYSPAKFAPYRDLLDRTIASNRPFAFDLNVSRDGRQYFHCEAVGMPVLSPVRDETWLMGGLFYFDWS